MQIHELNNFAGTPTSTDYLAIDNSTTTTKIGATGLGIQTQMTVAEATTGTSTSSRVITPKVLHDYVTTTGVTDVQVNGTSVTSSGTANIQDSDFLSAETIAKWDAILGIGVSVMANLNDMMDYLADECTLQTSTVTRASGWSEGINWVKKKFGIVQMYFEVSGGTLASSGWTTVGTLPEGFRPKGTYIDIINLDNSRSSDCCIKIGTGGAIQVYKTSTLSNNLRLYAMFTTW